MPDQVLVDVGLGVEHQAVLGLLDLVQEEHDHDGEAQGHQGRIEGDTEALRHTGDVAGGGARPLL